MIGWIARDKGSDLYFFDQKPFRDGGIWNTDLSGSVTLLEDFFFNHPIEWSDEPLKVELCLKEVAE